jgi:hypothetical protein
MKKYLSLSLLTACAAIGLGTGSAHANGWPTSVVGSWNVQANQSALVLRISTQAAGSGCVAITGTITDLAVGGQSNNIQGFYCPLSGRVSFLRKNVQTNDTFQTYVGNLSMAGAKNYMGGTFLQEDVSGNLGEYSFQASK